MSASIGSPWILSIRRWPRPAIASWAPSGGGRGRWGRRGRGRTIEDLHELQLAEDGVEIRLIFLGCHQQTESYDEKCGRSQGGKSLLENIRILGEINIRYTEIP